jgi:hypothetical protein
VKIVANAVVVAVTAVIADLVVIVRPATVKAAVLAVPVALVAKVFADRAHKVIVPRATVHADLVPVVINVAVAVGVSDNAVAAADPANNVANVSNGANRCRCRKSKSIFCRTKQPSTSSRARSARPVALIRCLRSRN